MHQDRFSVVIPARFASSRFPGKALALLAGRTLLEHVWRQAQRSDAAEVIVATDDERIATVAQNFGAEVMLTLSAHSSGTDRVAEVAARRHWPDDRVVVNCQGDAPLIPPGCLNQVATLLRCHPDAALATLCTPITNAAEYGSPHVVKVVCNSAGRALYFSRAPIPAVSHAGGNTPPRAAHPPESFRHLGLYAYRVGALGQLARAPVCALEISESLEQLRALWLGFGIQVGRAENLLGPDVDTPDDLLRAEKFLATAGEIP